ncbi:unnamed protein product [Linum tenue]|uniref:CCHC-type domain-containing protein n=1 Tax=Linum tenue TaxID=586396 RepID=A0AAV0KWD7_9ROSI|nr:unnamed protein product [Linum tenue]
MDLNNDTFLATFGNDQDYVRALTGGPWVILDHYLIVHQWSPSFRTSDKPHRSVVAWVQLPELPVHFYHREILFALGNLIGRTVKLDYHTENLERGKFARIAVELDMTRPLPSRIRLDGAWQQITYENLPIICYECGRIGHVEEDCPQLLPPQNLALVTIPGQSQPTPPTNNSPEPPSGFGPWMQVTRKSRRSSRKPSANASPNITQSRDSRHDVGNGSASTKGKQDQANGKIILEAKAKGDQKTVNKKGNATTQKGKALAQEEKGNINKKKEIQEWRVVDNKGQDFENNHSSEAHSMTAFGASSSKTKAQEQKLTIGPNNTKIHAIQVPPLILAQKENQNPNESHPSVRHHYQRKNADRSSTMEKTKGINLKATKKPLQLSSSAKKELTSKFKEAHFPITIESIEKFFHHTQKMASGDEIPQTGETSDVNMADGGATNQGIVGNGPLITEPQMALDT